MKLIQYFDFGKVDQVIHCWVGRLSFNMNEVAISERTRSRQFVEMIEKMMKEAIELHFIEEHLWTAQLLGDKHRKGGDGIVEQSEYDVTYMT